MAAWLGCCCDACSCCMCSSVASCMCSREIMGCGAPELPPPPAPLPSMPALLLVTPPSMPAPHPPCNGGTWDEPPLICGMRVCVPATEVGGRGVGMAPAAAPDDSVAELEGSGGAGGSACAAGSAGARAWANVPEVLGAGGGGTATAAAACINSKGLVGMGGADE
eukprot:CAMPEP_0202357800 /NCGR_PEP_ID=MMETSP1126-20121109/11685_1 /ASSEMBLY_ACC=CAM_ASM_000457 /TAXON_ID=3047 /ORGANISM="Dunaliella tertiolecta, Strain CCMP1320" /LENGTH=164 /DNA_ID=CAMNT_0048950759 /DNA_START=474 /DNA_END=966 /DNA_ORIENTATION=-